MKLVYTYGATIFFLVFGATHPMELANNSDINAPNKCGITQLYTILTERGGLKLIKHLLEQKADPNISYYGTNCLHAELYNRKSPACIALLLKHRANPNAKSVISGDTPSHLALCLTEPKDMIKLLTLLGAADADFGIQDNEGNTPFHVAAHLGWNNVDALKRLMHTSKKSLLSEILNKKNNDGLTPYNVAWQSYKAFICIQERQKSCYSDIHYVSSIIKDIEINKEIRKIVHPQNCIESSDAISIEMLKALQTNASVSTIKHLLGKKADPNKLLYGSSSIELALAYNDGNELIDLLYTYGLKPDKRNVLGETPLHLAVNSTCTPAHLATVIKYNLNFGVEDNEGNTVFHHVALNNSAQACSLLTDGYQSPAHKTIKTFLMINLRNKGKKTWFPRLVLSTIFKFIFPKANVYTTGYKPQKGLKKILEKKNSNGLTAHQLAIKIHNEKVADLHILKKNRAQHASMIYKLTQEICAIKKIKKKLCTDHLKN